MLPTPNPQRAAEATAFQALEDARTFVAVVEGLVSQLKAQGFTDEQARQITTACFIQRGAES